MEKFVKELWWEGDDLHIIDEDNKHEIYTNVSITGYNQLCTCGKKNCEHLGEVVKTQIVDHISRS